MEKAKQTERAEKKPDKATQTNEKEPLVTKTVIEIRHNLVFPRNLDYIQSVHQMQPLSYFMHLGIGQLYLQTFPDILDFVNLKIILMNLCK